MFSVAFGAGDKASVAVVTALALFYTFEGGMRAVIWTDVLQFGLYIFASVASFFILLHKIPSGWIAVTSAAAAAGGKLQVFDFTFSLTRSYTFWSGSSAAHSSPWPATGPTRPWCSVFSLRVANAKARPLFSPVG